MKILLHLLSGLSRSVRGWKWIILIWFCTLLPVSLFTIPFKSGIYASLSSSMISEKIAGGYFLDVIANDSFNLKMLLSFFFPGLFLVSFIGFILNVFFAGGLFNILKGNGTVRKSRDFFGGASANFWSFLVISIIIFFILFILTGIIIGIPALFATASHSEYILSKTICISGVVLLILLPLIVIIADFSRAWQVTSEEKNAFKAFGRGFRLLFRNFFRAYFSVAIVLAVQILFTFLAVRIILFTRTAGSGGIFLLYLLGQVFAVIKIFFRSWRYGTITDLYESGR